MKNLKQFASCGVVFLLCAEIGFMITKHYYPKPGPSIHYSIQTESPIGNAVTQTYDLRISVKPQMPEKATFEIMDANDKRQEAINYENGMLTGLPATDSGLYHIRLTDEKGYVLDSVSIDGFVPFPEPEVEYLLSAEAPSYDEKTKSYSLKVEVTPQMPEDAHFELWDVKHNKAVIETSSEDSLTKIPPLEKEDDTYSLRLLSKDKSATYASIDLSGFKPKSKPQANITKELVTMAINDLDGSYGRKYGLNNVKFKFKYLNLDDKEAPQTTIANIQSYIPDIWTRVICTDVKYDEESNVWVAKLKIER